MPYQSKPPKVKKPMPDQNPTATPEPAPGTPAPPTASPEPAQTTQASEPNDVEMTEADPAKAKERGWYKKAKQLGDFCNRCKVSGHTIQNCPRKPEKPALPRNLPASRIGKDGQILKKVKNRTTASRLQSMVSRFSPAQMLEYRKLLLAEKEFEEKKKEREREREKEKNKNV